MNFFVKSIVLGALLYATRGNGASVKRSDASWAKEYDYVSDNTSKVPDSPQKVIGYALRVTTDMFSDTDRCWGRYSRRSTVNSIEPRTSGFQDTSHRGWASCAR